MERLKNDTRHAHKELERRLDLFHRVRAPRDYAGILAAFLGFYRPLEVRLGLLHPWRELGLDFEPRRKSHLLARDLVACGGSPDVADCPPAELPRIPSLGQACGCLYVLEGATLGGQVITRYLHNKFGLTDTTGLSFHNCYAAQTAIRWEAFQDFLNHLNDVLELPDFERQAVAGAADTFESLSNWLSANLKK